VKVSFSAREFLKELEFLAKIMANKPAMPILNNILIQASEDGMRLAASRMDLNLVTYCPGTVLEAGDTTLPARHLLDVLRLLVDKEVTFTDEANGVRVSAGNYSSRIPTMAASQFPTMPTLNGLQQITLTSVFREMIGDVLFAADTKSGKTHLEGALLTGQSLIATDGQCLSLRTSEENDGSPVPQAIVIPRKALEMLAEFRGEETLYSMGDKHTFFVVDGRLLIASRLSEDDKFQDYNRIIPKDCTFSVDLPREELITGVKLAALTNKYVDFAFVPDELTLSSKSKDGESSEKIPVVYSGEASSITLGADMLLNFLEAADEDVIRMSWTGASKPVLFNSSEYFTYVQMPLRMS